MVNLKEILIIYNKTKLLLLAFCCWLKHKLYVVSIITEKYG